jgi:heptosyltransferase I
VGVLDGAALVVSLDTGPMHAAVALGAPTIALAGYYDPKRTGPYRRFGDLLVDAYRDAGEDSPPSARKRSGRTRAIPVAEVLERVERWRARHAGPRLDALRAAGILPAA